MLDLRPCCECCGADLAPDAADAFICSFECTFCRSCRDGPLNGRCPNCGGELQPRPARPTAALLAYPAYLAALAFALPPINDVSTDPKAPPPARIPTQPAARPATRRAR